MKIKKQLIKVRGGNDIKKLVDSDSDMAFRRILGGLGWPYAERPGFVVVLGEDFGPDHSLQHSPRHYRILAEHETSDLEELQRICHKFREDFCLRSILGNPENPVREIWKREGVKISVVLPCDLEKIDLNLIAQLVRRNTEGRKTLHFGDSKIPGYLTRFVADRIESESLEQFPPMTAFGFVLAEIELRGHSSLAGFRPDRSKLAIGNRMKSRRRF
ncbi:MAG: hypothetical protein H8E19_17420 [Deltaproteobacteria bacterium]|uniref:Uncharacterized protein n=1 Tax=Candidatus Desulfacyla euxinica TaxID=2841693 RepID=A0A8J6T954_9DELT|nr:hypothetical protein [Candidatus Desulfacyla euxinica]